MPKVLVIDDDDITHRLIKSILGHAGYEVYRAMDGSEGMQQFQLYQPDLVILNLLLPKTHGWQICQQLRQYSNVPIMILTSQTGSHNLIHSLDIGADDYLPKPFEIGVLLAKVRALLRRTNQAVKVDQLHFYDDGYLIINQIARQVFLNGQRVELTPTEFGLLEYLCKRAGQLCTYSQILGDLWQWEKHPIAVLHQTMRRLRRKLKESPLSPRYLLTEYGVGYRFKKHTAL